MRLTAKGEVDTAYYIAQAQLMRTEAMIDSVLSLKDAIVGLLKSVVPTRFGKAFSH